MDKGVKTGEMMTVAEVADFLNLNEKIIYRLVRQGRMPGTKITGKWTFPRRLINQWIEANALRDATGLPEGPSPDVRRDLFIAGSNDIILEHIIAILLKGSSPEGLVFFANTGSLGGLRALALGKAQIAGLHLYSPETDTYNAPFLKSLVPGRKTILFNLAYRRQGLIIRPDLADRVGGVADLSEGRFRLINREDGTGTRHLLDLELKKNGIDPAGIPGYSNEVSTHLEVGLTILSGEADIGLGIEPVARLLGLGFIPLTRERYDLAVPLEFLDTPPVAAFVDLLQSQELRGEAGRLPGYELEEMGKIVH